MVSFDSRCDFIELQTGFPERAGNTFIVIAVEISDDCFRNPFTGLLLSLIRIGGGLIYD